MVNILTTKEGTVKLADFGVATRLPDGRLPLQARQDDDVAGVCVCVCVYYVCVCVCIICMYVCMYVCIYIYIVG
jgi:hypothetical protein